MLRLVHPAREGQEPPKRRKGARSTALHLTPEENRHLRATIRNLSRAYGSLECLAMAMGVRPATLYHQRHHSPALALAVARAGGMSIEAVLGGKLGEAGRCPTCGHRVGADRARASAASEGGAA